LRFIPKEKYAHENINTKIEKSEHKFDVRGAILLGVTITTFLLFITSLRNDSFNEGGNQLTLFGIPNSAVIFFMIFVASFASFFLFERKTKVPLITPQLFLDRRILSSNIILLIVGMSMFTIFQTLPILAQSPVPVGFDNSAIQMSLVQLPFAIVLLVSGPLVGVIITRIGQTTPLVIGTIAMSLGFFLLFFIRPNEFYISSYLVIISIGISLTNVSSTNIVMMQSSFKQIGISLGISNLLRIIGSSIGPTIAGLFMQTHLFPINSHDNQFHYFPSSSAYDLIFGTMLGLSLSALCISLFLVKNRLKNKNYFTADSN